MMRAIGCVLNELVYNLAHKDNPDALRGHPGCSATILANGLSGMSMRYEADEIEAIRSEVKAAFESGAALCESPIEREMLAALLTGNWGFFDENWTRLHYVSDKSEPLPDVPFVIIPQYKIARFRLDFAVCATGRFGKTIFGIECDGAAYHDAVDDRERDAVLLSHGIPVLRVTGTEIHRDAHEAASGIVSKIVKWSLQ